MNQYDPLNDPLYRMYRLTGFGYAPKSEGDASDIAPIHTSSMDHPVKRGTFRDIAPLLVLFYIIGLISGVALPILLRWAIK